MLHFGILFMTALATDPAPLINLVDSDSPHSITLMIKDQPVPVETGSDGQLLQEEDSEHFTLPEEETVESDIPDESLKQPAETLIQVIDQHHEPLSSQPLLLDGEEVMTDEEGYLLLHLAPGDHKLSRVKVQPTFQPDDKNDAVTQEASEVDSSTGSSDEISRQQRAPERIAAALVIQKPTVKPQKPKISKTPALHRQSDSPSHDPVSQQQTLKQPPKKTINQKTKPHQNIPAPQKAVKVPAKKEKTVKAAQTLKKLRPKTPFEATHQAISKTSGRKVSNVPQLPVAALRVDPRSQVSTEEVMPPKVTRPQKKKSAQLPQTGEHDITKWLSSILAVSGISLLLITRRSSRT